MKTKLLLIVTTVTLLSFPKLNFGQAPNLGTAANFVLFSSNGALTSTAVLSQLTGNVGTNIGSNTGFGNVNGVMHAADTATMQASKDLLKAYNKIDSTKATFFPAPSLGGGQTIFAGVDSISGATTLNSILTLDGGNDPNALFIFKIQGPFSTTVNAKVKLTHGAMACNVFWKVEGLVSIAAGTSMVGTIIANNAAIHLNINDTLEGRALSTTGAVSVDGVLAYIPKGCGSVTLNGPTAPTLGVAACYAIFTSTGTVANSGTTNVTGDVGSNTAAPTGFNSLLVTGKIHASDGSTGACAADLLTAYNYLNTLPYDIELMSPSTFGFNLVLTPHTYIMKSAAALTDTVYLNAENVANAVFVIRVNGAFSTSSLSRIKLINGTLAKNVYWLINGQTDINDSSIFNGTVICKGAMNLTKLVKLNGRALSIVGAITTADMNALASVIPGNCSTVDVASIDAINEAVTIYPNPFTTSATIVINNISQINNCELLIYNVLGAVVKNVSITNQSTTLNTNDLPAGIYFYKIVGNNKTVQTGRLVSQQ